MRQTIIYLSDEQWAALGVRAAAEETSVAELVRRLIDQALLGTNEDLADDLGAIDASFGTLRDDEIDVDRADGERAVHLPPGRRAGEVHESQTVTQGVPLRCGST